MTHTPEMHAQPLSSRIRPRAARIALMTVAMLSATAACTGGDTGASSRTAAAATAADSVAAGPVREIPGPAPTPPRSPDRYTVRFETSKGPFVVEVERALAPRGADRFHELVTIGFFDDVRFYRVVPGFIVQFGKHGTVAVNDAWVNATIPDDPMRISNTKGTVAFAANGPDSRATELFISTGENGSKLDRQRVFAPIGRVTQGMDVVEQLNAEYGEEPNHARIARQGNAYLERWFPALDYIKEARVVEGGG